MYFKKKQTQSHNANTKTYFSLCVCVLIPYTVPSYMSNTRTQDERCMKTFHTSHHISGYEQCGANWTWQS